MEPAGGRSTSTESGRSKTGCYTCRARKKKCCERFNAQGRCSRCEKASIHCERTAPIRPRRSNPKRKAPQLTGSDTPSSASTAPSQPCERPGFDASQLASVTVESAPPTSSCPLLTDSSGHSPGTPVYSTESIPPAPPLLVSHENGRDTSSPSSVTSSSAFPNYASASLLSDYPLVNPFSVQSSSGSDHWNNHLFGFLESETSGPNPELSLQPPFPPIDWIALSAEFSFELADQDASSSQKQHASCLGSVSSEASSAESNEVAAWEAAEDLPGDIAAIYEAVNSDFLLALPKPARDVITRRLQSLATSTELGRAASMALCMLQALRLPNNHNEEGRRQLLAKSNAYFERAIIHITDVAIPLESQLNAVIDMHYHQLDAAGAAGAYAILLIGELFITQALGPRPTLDLSARFGPQHVCLRFFSYIDVFRSLCLGERKTVFDYAHPIAAQDIDNNPSSPDEFQCSAYFGLPNELLLCFAASSNLALDLPGLSKVQVRERAAEIETQIRSWRPMQADPEPIRDSLSYLSNLATQEMWRHAALIHLYQAVLKLGCVSQCVRQSLRQIVEIGSRSGLAVADRNDPISAAGCTRACPWFLASTVAVDAEDRQACRIGLQDCGPAKVFVDNLKAAELLWDRMDVDGRADNWQEILREEGMFVAFL